MGLREKEVAEMQAAIDKGRCWEVFHTEYDICDWVIGGKAAARAKAAEDEMEGFDLVPTDRFAAFVRRSGDVEPLQPLKPIKVHGVKWPAAERNGYVHVEHPRLGWVRVGLRGDLPRFLARVAELSDAIGRYEGKRDDDDGDLCNPACVCTTAWDAASLENGEVVPWKFTPGVAPLHVEPQCGWWVYWSDGVMTAGSHIVDERQSLEADAIKLINLAWQFHPPDAVMRAPACGWATLARVAEIIASEELARGTKRLGNPREAIHRFDVRTVDGERMSLWARSGPALNPEELVYDFHTEHPDDWRCNARGALLPLG